LRQTRTLTLAWLPRRPTSRSGNPLNPTLEVSLMSTSRRTLVVLSLLAGLGACSHAGYEPGNTATGSSMGNSLIGSGSNTNGIESIPQQFGEQK
jgi:hypothetical protein